MKFIWIYKDKNDLNENNFYLFVKKICTLLKTIDIFLLDSMCPDSQPMTCDNTCLTASCAHFTGSLCQVNLCTCQPEFYDPITRQKVNCDAGKSDYSRK
jgi:hypothetical protein